MRANTAIGIGMAFVVLFLAVIMEGGSPASLLNIPALLIVCGGTAGATLASTSMAQFKKLPKLYKKAIKPDEQDPGAAIDQLVKLAEKARREGLLALERDLKELDDEFAKKGLQLVVDGTDSTLVRSILQSEIDSMSARHAANAKIFQTGGGFAPTLGILGTVLSLVHVLENLSDPGSLGHSIAGAFLATLYGVGSANLIYLPVGNRLKELSGEEQTHCYLLLEAILSIQAGDNPRLLREKLETFLSPDQKAGAQVKKVEPAATAADEPPAEQAA